MYYAKYKNKSCNVNESNLNATILEDKYNEIVLTSVQFFPT